MAQPTGSTERRSTMIARRPSGRGIRGAIAGSGSRALLQFDYLNKLAAGSAIMSSVNKPPVASLSGTNLEFARSHNRRVVMEAIRLHGRLTRADIARLTALTPQTISNIASE